MSGPITSALARLKNGDPLAGVDLDRILQPFFLDLLKRLRRNLLPSLKPRIDSQGIVNEVLNDFLLGVCGEKFPQMKNSEDVKKVLTTLFTRTLSDEVKKQTQAKRSVLKDVSLHSPLGQRLADRSENEAGIAELLENIQQTVRGAHKRAIDIVILLAEGYTTAEIARELSLGVRMVEVIKKRMRDSWERAIARELESPARRDGASS